MLSLFSLSPFPCRAMSSDKKRKDAPNANTFYFPGQKVPTVSEPLSDNEDHDDNHHFIEFKAGDLKPGENNDGQGSNSK